jgi:hypothetical protein
VYRSQPAKTTVESRMKVGRIVAPLRVLRRKRTSSPNASTMTKEM